MAGQTSYAAMKSHYYFFFEGKKVITNCELKLYESRLYLELGSQIRGCYKTHMRVYIWNGLPMHRKCGIPKPTERKRENWCEEV